MDISKSRIILATFLGALVLFVFDGSYQALPNFGVRAVERIESNDLTTSKFTELSDRMAYIASDNTVSFVATKKANYYNLLNFFILEFLSDIVISLLFALVFGLIKFKNFHDRIVLTLAFSLIASFAIHIPYFNWWGFSTSYTIGVVSKTIFGWILLSFVQNKLIFKFK